jgi:reverse transcriptase-like protein
VIWTSNKTSHQRTAIEFARYMSDNLREFLNEFVVVYFDDFVIYSDDLKTHWQYVRTVLQRIQEKRINLKKCEFAVQETNYLGHVVNGETTKMQYEKLKAILEWPTPSNCKDIEEFEELPGIISKDSLINVWGYFFTPSPEILGTCKQSEGGSKLHCLI